MEHEQSTFNCGGTRSICSQYNIYRETNFICEICGDCVDMTCKKSKRYYTFKKHFIY